MAYRLESQTVYQRPQAQALKYGAQPIPTSQSVWITQIINHQLNRFVIEARAYASIVYGCVLHEFTLCDFLTV